jgi:type VI secretion system secreted protein Hcp
MAVDAFIWFTPSLSIMPKPKGESKDAKYGSGTEFKAFEIKDFSFGVENVTTIGSATGGAGSGKIKFNEFTIKKTSDSASPNFFKNCCAGAHYKEVIVEMRKAGGDAMTTGKAFLRFKFDTVFTTKIDWSGPGDEGPEESITFVYGNWKPAGVGCVVLRGVVGWLGRAAEVTCGRYRRTCWKTRPEKVKVL